MIFGHGNVGGLKSELSPGDKPGSIIAKPAGFYGVPPARPGQEASGSILRTQVAELCVAGEREERCQRLIRHPFNGKDL